MNLAREQLHSIGFQWSPWQLAKILLIAIIHKIITKDNSRYEIMISCQKRNLN